MFFLDISANVAISIFQVNESGDLQGYFYIDMAVVGVGRLTIYMVTLSYTADGK